MPTQLFLRSGVSETHRGTNTARLDGTTTGWTSRAMSTSRGGIAVTLVGNTVTGPTNGVEVATGSSSNEWISLPLDADVTISGTITLNIWAHESNMSANVAINVIIERLNSEGGIVSTIAQTSRTTEVAVTTAGVNNFTVSPTSTNMLKGERLRIRVYGDDAGTMATGFTFTITYDGPTASAAGDTYITFNETFGFLTTVPSGTQIFLTDTAGPVVGTQVEKEMWTSRGNGVNSFIVDSAAGWVAPRQWTNSTTADTPVEWYSRGLTAFTLSGLIRCNIRASESNIAANSCLRAEIAVCDNDGSNAVVWGATNHQTELTTSEVAYTLDIAGGDVSVTDGQRLRLRLYLDDLSSVPMVTGHSATVFYDGTSGGATGDSYITLTQSVTEYVPGLSAEIPVGVLSLVGNTPTSEKNTPLTVGTLSLAENTLTTLHSEQLPVGQLSLVGVTPEGIVLNDLAVGVLSLIGVTPTSEKSSVITIGQLNLFGGSYISTNLESFWSCEESSGTFVDDVGSNDLTETSGTIPSVPGRVGNGREFTASDTEYATINSNSSLSIPNNSTSYEFACWVRLKTTSDNQTVFGKRSGLGIFTNLEYMLRIDSGVPKFYWGDTVSGFSSVSGSSLTAGINYLITCGYDASISKFFITINAGSETLSGAVTTQSVNQGNVFTFGGNADGEHLDGVLDELGFWKGRKLTADERNILLLGLPLSALLRQPIEAYVINDVAVGTLTLFGTDVGVVQAGESVAVGILSLVGNTPTTEKNTELSIGTLSLNANTPTTIHSQELSIGTLSLIGNTPTTEKNTALTVGILSLVGVTPNTLHSETLTIGTLTLNAITPTTIHTQELPIGTLSLIGNTPTTSKSQELSIGVLSLIGVTPTTQHSQVVTVGILSLVGTELGVITGDNTIPVGTLSLLGTSLGSDKSFILPFGTLSLVGTEVDHALSSIVTVGTLTLVGITLNTVHSQTITVGNLSLVGISLDTAHSQVITVGILNLVGTVLSSHKHQQIAIGILTLFGTEVIARLGTILIIIGDISFGIFSPADTNMRITGHSTKVYSLSPAESDMHITGHSTNVYIMSPGESGP